MSALEDAQAEPGRWLLDADRTSVRFRQRSLWGLVAVAGRFTRVTGEAATGAVTHGRVRLAADSIETGIAKRDAHLRSAAFLDAEKHSWIEFETSSVRVTGDGAVHVRGRVRVAGRSAGVDFTAAGQVTAAGDVELRARVWVDRRELGLTHNPLRMISGPTRVDVAAVFVRVTGRSPIA